MIEEHGVHGLAYPIITTETKREVADAATCLCQGQVLLDPRHGTDEVYGISLMFTKSCANREDVDVEDDVLGRETDARQQRVGALGNSHLSVEGRRLAFLVESHHDDGSPQATQLAGLAEEVVGTVFQTDGVDDALALRVLQTGQHGRPVAGVDHQHGTADGRVIADVATEGLHLLSAVKHGVVHINIDDSRPTLYLVAGHGERLVVLLVGNEARKLTRTGHIGTFADIGEVLGLAVDEQRFQPAEPQTAVHIRQPSWRQPAQGVADGTYVVLVGTATAAGNVQQTILCHLPQVAGGKRRQFFILAHLVGQSCVRI